MFEGQKDLSEECNHEQIARDWREKEEREREQRRAQTIGEFVAALAQKNANRRELADTLCQILDLARALYPDNDVCYGALVIAEAAISAAATRDDDFIYRWYGESLAKYSVLLAQELQGAKGAGYFDLDTRVLLEKITDLLPDAESDDWSDGWNWPSAATPIRYHHIKL